MRFYPVPSRPTDAQLKTFSFGTHALFKNFPEAIDYTFAADVLLGPDALINDRRMKYLVWLLDNGGSTRPEGWLVPWKDIGAYLERRPVAKIANERVLKFLPFWINPANPSGGSRDDEVAVTLDQSSFWVDTQVSTRTTAGGAGRELTGQMDYAGTSMTSQVEHTCYIPGGGTTTACTSETNQESIPVTVIGNYNVSDQNVGESDFVDLIPGEKPLIVKDIGGYEVTDTLIVDPGRFPAGSADLRQDAKAGYGDLFMVNSDSDELQVTIELNPQYRQDYQFYAGKEFGDTSIPAFGREDSVWTYDWVAPGGRLNDLNQAFGSGGAELYAEQDKHLGYRQPLLSRAYYCGPVVTFENNKCLNEGDPTNRAAYDSDTSYDPADVGRSFTDRNVTHIKWPVNLQDMNWYMYQLPGGGPNSSEWLLWVHDRGARHLIQSGYGIKPATAFPDCSIEGDRTLEGGNILPGSFMIPRILNVFHQLFPGRISTIRTS